MNRLPFLLLWLFPTLPLYSQFIRFADINPADMAYSRITERVYIAVTDQDDISNLCVVNPRNANVDTCYSLPGRLISTAVSEDGQFLYVGSIFPSRLYRIHLPDETIDLEFTPLNNDPAYKLLVTPDDNRSVLAIHAAPSGAYITAIYDDSIPRPKTVLTTNEVAFGVSPSTLFGIQAWSSGNQVIIYHVDADGIAQLQPWSINPVPPNTHIRTTDHYLVTSTGFIYDISSGQPEYYSFYFNEPFKPGGPFAFDQDSGVVYFALDWEPTPEGVQLRTFSLDGTDISATALPGIDYGPSKLLECGGSGRLAFNANGKTAFLNPCTGTLPRPVIEYPQSGFCEGDTITLTGPAGAQAYFWSTGESSSAIRVSLGKDYWLAVADDSGCLTAYSDTIRPVFDNRPPRPVITGGNGSNILCNNDTLILSAPRPAGWGIPLDVQWNTGDTTESILLNGGGGVFTAAFVTPHGCISEPANPREIEHIVALQPGIGIGNMSLLASSPNAVQWFFNDSLLAGQTFPGIMLFGPGVYRVQATTPEGCKSPFAVYYNDIVPIFPNPATDQISLLYDSFGQIASYRIVNNSGNVVLSGNASEQPIIISSLSIGNYTVFWFDADGNLIGHTPFVKII